LSAYLSNQGNERMNNTRDDQHLKIQALMNDITNIKQSQQSYGVPTIGDLFRATPADI
jgi:hypothetical protein